MHNSGRVVFYYLALAVFGASFQSPAAKPDGSGEPLSAQATKLCAPNVAAKAPERNHGAKEAPPSQDILFRQSQFVTVDELPSRSEVSTEAFTGFSEKHPGLGILDATGRAARTNILIPVTDQFPLNAATVTAGVRQGYYFYFPFLEPNPYERYENPAFRALISMDAMMVRLRSSDFVTQIKSKSHIAPPGSPAGAEKTQPIFRISFNERSDEVFEAAANSERLARDPKTKALLLDANQKPYFTQDTWITPNTIELYKQLAKENKVFTIAVWRTIFDPGPREVLAGGAIGLCIDGFYSSETLFTNHDQLPGSNPEDGIEIGNGVAGKLAIFTMFDYLESQGVRWVDAQTVNDTTGRMGAQYIPRAQYLPLLRDSIEQGHIVNFPPPNEAYQVRFHEWTRKTLGEKLDQKRESGTPLLLVAP